MELRTPRLAKSTVFAVLMAVSLAGMLLPPAWTNWLRHVPQLLVPAQDVLYRAGLRASQAAGVAGPAAGRSALDAAGQNDRRALENQLLFQSGLLEQLRAENSALRGLRGRYVPPATRLIPARVVARDVVAARDSVLLDRGESRGVRWRDWVLSRTFIDRGADEGVEHGFAVVAREFLLGRVEAVSPYMARVRLFSDLDSRLPVRVGRIEQGRFRAVDYPCVVRGLGHGRMAIADVPLRLVDQEFGGASPHANRMHIDDLVAATADSYGLTAAMGVGRVRAFNLDPKKRLVATVEVEPAVGVDALADVFVIASVPESDDPLGGPGP